MEDHPGTSGFEETQAALEELRDELRRALEETARLSATPQSVEAEDGLDFRSAVADYERALIVAALQAAGGKQKRAAEILHLRPSTLNVKMKSLGIDPNNF